MAKYKGLFKGKEGSIGDVTFAKTKDGYQMREKNEVSAEAIATSPTYQRTRENMAEFGRAGKASRLLRTAFNTLVQSVKDRHVSSRLVKEMMQAVKADSVNPRGQRTVTDGDLSFLKGFEFNNGADLNGTLTALYTTVINRATGVINVDILPLVPIRAIKAPIGTTHYRVVCGAAEIDFDAETYTTDIEESAYLPWTAAMAPSLSLTANVPAASTHPLFLVVGVLFFQEVNGLYYELKSADHNALRLVDVQG
jgi:hypothetical protein